MSESRLGRALRELKVNPELDPEFKKRVMASLEDAPPRKTIPLWYGSVAATLALFLGAATWVQYSEKEATRSLRKAEIQSVRQEIESIKSALNNKPTAEPQVVLWVASTKNVDLFMDAKPWAHQIGVQPASYTRED